jgi:hypothetical protein
MSNDQIEDLIRSRDESYGEAWLLAGEMARLLNLDKVTDAGFLYVLLVMLSKIARITSSPTKLDHWKDIAGYATLVFQHLEKVEDDRIPF